MTNFVSIKVKGKYKHFEVPNEVYLYIKQLENGIKFPDLTGKILKKQYRRRFNG